MQYNILEYLEQSAQKVPNKIAFADDKSFVLYQELETKAKRIGTVLHQSLRGAMRQPIVVFVDRNIESLISFLGVAYSGNFYVPIDITMPKMRIELILQTLKPLATLVLRQDVDFAHSVAPGLTKFVFEEIIEIPENDSDLLILRRKIIDRDPLYATFTSGSTGIPKGVITCHQSVIDMTDNLVNTFQFKESDIFGNQNPFYFDASIKDIYSALSCGATMYVIPKRCFMMLGELIDFINEKEITTIMWSAAAIALVANSGVLTEKVPNTLKQVMFSGEVMHNKTLNQWRKVLPKTRFVNLYGPTEITSVCTYYIIEKVFSDDEVLPIGIPFKNTEILLLNNKNEIVGNDEQGELCVRGCCLALGYYNNDEKTAQAFCQNPTHNHYPEIIYRTGDIAKYNELGEILFLSRKDNQVKHMGQRVELGEIEILVNSFEKIDASVCFYDHDKQKIVLVYQGQDADHAYILNELKIRVSKFMLPNIMFKLKEMPYNLNGKIDRTLLKSQYSEKVLQSE
jgi:amino acid adenylation domain-containing protein